MAAPNKKRPRAPWKRHKPGRPKESLEIIIGVLEESPGTFEELCERTTLARTTLSDGLTELENRGRVARTIEPLKTEERGRGKRHRVIIQLSKHEQAPVPTTLRHLEHLTPIPKIDIKEGNALLVPDVVDAVLIISTLSFRSTKTPSTPSCPRPPTFECYKERTEEEKKQFDRMYSGREYYEKLKSKRSGYKFELDECLLIRALARFSAELYVIELLAKNQNIDYPLFLSRLRNPSGWEFYRELDHRKAELTEFLRRGVDDPELFPAMGITKQTGTLERFMQLLEWIRPLIETPYMVDARRTYPDWKAEFGEKFGDILGFEIKHISPFTRRNLIAAVFTRDERDYLDDFLFPQWGAKLYSLHGKRKGNGKENPRSVKFSKRGATPLKPSRRAPR
jgi:hypothetical protein